MERLEILVRGEVQRVGYRDRVQKIARRNNITGWVKNTLGYDVQIVAEGKGDDLQRFRSEIQISDGPIQVESIEIVHEPYLGDFKFFEIIRGLPDEEMGERFDAAIHYLIRIDTNSQRSVEIGEKMLEKQDRMLEKQDRMLEKQDRMLEKQDRMLENQDLTLGKQDLMIGKQDRMLEKQDTMISLQIDTISEIKGMKQEIVHTLESRYVSIEHQLDEIRSALKKAGIMT